MANLGWSYPAGCDGPPDEDIGPCECCGLSIEYDPDDGGCMCPECPDCGAIGDPGCYPLHGLIFTPAQLKSRAETRAREYDLAERIGLHMEANGIDFIF